MTRSYYVMNGNYGFIHEKLEIKVLILYILRRLSEPISLDELAELAICDDGICYFDFAECVAELVRTEHLLVVGNKYSLTRKGVRNGEITEANLPFSIRMKINETTSELRAIQNRNAMIKTTHVANRDGGCTVKLSMSDGKGEIISMELFAANEQQAIDLEKGFREKAEKIYNAIIEMIM